jgi:hypothetical protein
MRYGTVEPTEAEIAEFVRWVVGCLHQGERLPLDLRVAFGITAEVERAMRVPDEANVVGGDE